MNMHVTTMSYGIQPDLNECAQVFKSGVSSLRVHQRWCTHTLMD